MRDLFPTDKIIISDHFTKKLFIDLVVDICNEGQMNMRIQSRKLLC